LVLVAIVGSWVVVHGIVEGTVVLATRADRPLWQLGVLSAAIEIVVGLTLIARPGGTINGAAVTLGVLAVLEGIFELASAMVRLRSERHQRRSPATPSVAVMSHDATAPNDHGT
jgi:uncharacterized membrane protein HdeD (DUF308 family)